MGRRREEEERKERGTCITFSHSSPQLLSDKDTLVSALNAAHDGHLLAIDSKEDAITLSAKADLNHLLEGLQESEHARNRQKVTEIQRYIAQQKEEGEAATTHQTP